MLVKGIKKFFEVLIMKIEERQSYYESSEEKYLSMNFIQKEEFKEHIRNLINEVKEKFPEYPDYQLIPRASTYVFNALYKDNILPHLRIPFPIISKLKREERMILQTQLETDMLKRGHGHSFNKNENCTPLDVLSFICGGNDSYFSTDILEKLNYAFSYLFERNLTTEEKGYISVMYDTHVRPYETNTINNEFLVKKAIIDTATRKLNKSHRMYMEKKLKEQGFSILMDVLLDTALPEVTISCIERFFLYTTDDTLTYYKLIVNCLMPDDPKSCEGLMLREAESLRKYISSSIHNNDKEKQFYQSQRGPGYIRAQNTLAQCEKDVYELIYLMHGRRGLRKPSAEKKISEKKKDSDSEGEEFTQEQVNKLYSKLDDILITKFQYTESAHELHTSYKSYADLIINEKAPNISKSLTETAQQLIRFHGIVDNYFKVKTENDWYNKTSIFYCRWDFMQTAACIWHRIQKETIPCGINSIEEMGKLYNSYCHEISKLKFPKTQLMLLEDRRFFAAYLESPHWVTELHYFLNTIFEISSLIIRIICNISDSPFSHKLEELSDLEEVLKQEYVYTPPKEKATPEMLAEFLELYLPKKVSRTDSRKGETA